MSPKRRIASFVLLVGAVLVGAKLFTAHDKLVPCTIVYRLPPGTTRLEATVRAPAGDEPLARYVTVVDRGAEEARQATRLPPGDHVVDVAITVDGVQSQRSRRVQVVRDAVITVDARWAAGP